MRIDNTIMIKISKISTININISIDINNKHEGKAATTIAKHKTAKTMNKMKTYNTIRIKIAKTSRRDNVAAININIYTNISNEQERSQYTTIRHFKTTRQGKTIKKEARAQSLICRE